MGILFVTISLLCLTSQFTLLNVAVKLMACRFISSLGHRP